MNAQENQVALPFRQDTLLGVCEAIGQDFGFNPNFLRVPFAASVIVSPMWAAIAYLALGVVVLASRLLAPKAKLTNVVEVEAEQREVVANDTDSLKAAA